MQEDLLERRLPHPASRLPRPESQRRTAPSPDRPGGELDQPWATLVPAQLDVHRAFDQTEGVSRILRTACERVLGGLRQARRRDVDRFFEKGAVERVGLVEEGEHVESTRHEQSLERHFRPGDEVLHQELPGGLTASGGVGLGEDLLEARHRGREVGRIVRADHPTTGGEAERLDHARIRDPYGQCAGVLINTVEREAWHGHARRRQRLAL